MVRFKDKDLNEEPYNLMHLHSNMVRFKEDVRQYTLFPFFDLHSNMVRFKVGVNTLDDNLESIFTF